MRKGFEPSYDGFAKLGEHPSNALDRENKAVREPRSTEIDRVETPVAQSWPNAEAALGAAIERLTRALAAASDDAIPDLVAERRAMREELEARRRAASGAVDLDTERARRRPRR